MIDPLQKMDENTEVHPAPKMFLIHGLCNSSAYVDNLDVMSAVADKIAESLAMSIGKFGALYVDDGKLVFTGLRLEPNEEQP